MSRPGDRVAPNHHTGCGWRGPRKVRTPQGTVVANSNPERSAGKCNRKYTANPDNWVGKGERVR